MKIEHLLVQHFYSAKQVTLQGIGTFSLSPDFVMPSENDKDLSIPPDAISFKYNSRATEDDALITYIVQQTRKIKPLASSDLESYIMLASQFLNIGKPFIIDGIGVLEKNQAGEYQFTQQGLYLNAKAENAPVQIREKSDEDISFASKVKPNGNNKKILMLLASFLVLGVIIWGAWYFLTKKKDTAVTENTEPTPPVNTATDTAKTDTAKLTVQQKPDSITAKPVTPAGADGYTFKIAFKVTTNKEAAIAKMNTLIYRGHKVIMYNRDSATYVLAEPFNLPLSDTTKIKDSLNRFYYLGKGRVELK